MTTSSPSWVASLQNATLKAEVTADVEAGSFKVADVNGVQLLEPIDGADVGNAHQVQAGDLIHLATVIGVGAGAITEANFI